MSVTLFIRKKKIKLLWLFTIKQKEQKLKYGDENFWQEYGFIIIYNAIQIRINLEKFFKFCDNLT